MLSCIDLDCASQETFSYTAKYNSNTNSKPIQIPNNGTANTTATTFTAAAATTATAGIVQHKQRHS